MMTSSSNDSSNTNHATTTWSSSTARRRGGVVGLLMTTATVVVVVVLLTVVLFKTITTTSTSTSSSISERRDPPSSSSLSSSWKYWGVSPPLWRNNNDNNHHDHPHQKVQEKDEITTTTTTTTTTTGWSSTILASSIKHNPSSKKKNTNRYDNSASTTTSTTASNHYYLRSSSEDQNDADEEKKKKKKKKTTTTTTHATTTPRSTLLDMDITRKGSSRSTTTISTNTRRLITSTTRTVTTTTSTTKRTPPFMKQEEDDNPILSEKSFLSTLLHDDSITASSNDQTIIPRKVNKMENNEKKYSAGGGVVLMSTPDATTTTTTTTPTTLTTSGSNVILSKTANTAVDYLFLHYEDGIDEDDDPLRNYFKTRAVVDVVAPGRRMLQTTTPTTTSICSNISDTFRTSIAIAFEGNTSLVTDQQTNLLALTFATTYNRQTSGSGSSSLNGGGGGGGTRVCDPYFRTITAIKATPNASFAGSNNNNGDNPIPIIPVRRLRLKQQQQQKQHEGSSSVLSLESVLWESLLKSHLVNSDVVEDHEFQKRQLQQQEITQEEPESSLASSTSNTNTLGGATGLNRTVGNFDIGIILLDIVGACRGCQQQGTFRLFDDTSSPTQRKRQLHRQQHDDDVNEQLEGLLQQRQRRQQEDDELAGETDGDCICPADTVPVIDSTTFDSSFKNDVQDLRDTGELEFVEDIEEIIPVIESECPTKDQEFSTVYLVTPVVFSSRILFTLGSKGVKAVELLFQQSYNGYAQQLCDPVYRSISKAQFVSIIDNNKKKNVRSEGNITTTDAENHKSTIAATSFVTMEFVVEATCRGDGCSDLGCLFDDMIGSCGDNGRGRRRQQTIDYHTGGFTPQDEEEEPVFMFPWLDTASTHGGNSRLLMEEEDEEESTERCFCRQARPERSPTQTEFKNLFQQGLDQITESSKLGSCEKCDMSSDCRSNVCLDGRCAETDTGLLLNGCSCSDGSSCESTFCQLPIVANETEPPGLQVVLMGTCQGKLASCRACIDGTDCLSGQCTGGRCGDATDGRLQAGCDCTSNLQCQSGRCRDNLIDVGADGQCTSKITDTCTEPCILSSDCVSGLCGSVVCLPDDGTLLQDGCFTSNRFECQSSRLVDNVCVPLVGLCGVCFVDSDCTTGRCTSGHCADSLGKLPNDCSCLADLDCASTLCADNICRAELTDKPTASPTKGPTPSPSTLPTGGPSANPSTSPTISPSTSSPSRVPTGGPTISPSAVPTVRPTSSPSMGPSTALPTEENECDPNPCGPGTCVDLVGGFECTCEDGYEFDDDEQTCIDIDECGGNNPCDTNADCMNNDGGFDCTCHDNFTGDGFTCDPEDCFVSTGLVDFDALFAFCNAHADGFKCCQNSAGIVGHGACFKGKYRREVEICKGSCVGDNACGNILGDVKFVAKTRSCRGIGACALTGTPVTVSEGSCLGYYSCVNGGGAATNGVSIGSNSCTSRLACFALGKNSNGVSIGNDSCQDHNDCYQLGRYAASVTVGSNACNGFLEDKSRGCYEVGIFSPGAVSIDDLACTQARSCEAVGRNASSVTIGESACRGQRSCQSCQDTPLEEPVVIEPNAGTCPY